MIYSPKIVWMPMLAASLAAVLFPIGVVAQNAQIQHIAVTHSGDAVEVHIGTTKRLLPLTEVITDPDRLVIDFPDAVPGPQVRTVSVNQGAVKSIRTSLLTSHPAMTRVVIDLKSPQDFQLVPTGTSVTVKLAGGNADATAAPSPQPAPEPVAAAPAPPAPVAKASVVSVAARPTITIERKPVATRPPLTAASVVTPSDQLPAAPASVVSSAPTIAPASAPIPASPTSSRPAQIRRVAVLKSGGATEIEIETSQRVVPTTQLITGPDRLVLDFASSLPGPQLRTLAVNQGEVKGVRAGLLTSKPPVTRVVLDLKSPQEFQLFPSGNAVIVKLPGSLSVAPVRPPSAPAAAEAPALPPEPPKKVQSSFQDGLLSITSTDGSLADVLNEIRRQTGADIAVPAGAEQEKVAAVLGPACPREVLSQLLNGSRYNFIIVGSDGDANKVDRVLLSAKNEADIPGPSEPQNADPEPQNAEPGPVAALSAPSARGVPSVRASAPPPPPVPPTDDTQPQGDSIPPDAPPQPGDPQPAPN